MNNIQWQADSPPHVGWWNCSFGKNNFPSNVWRWWNGEVWSVALTKWDFLRDVDKLAGCKESPRMNKYITWCDYYPADARVPRVKP